ncbi:copper resistance CopC family protein [Knoellia sp. S7-12]|uniref:copper resistance CopC family protein n=1 Tax=Knoellia sp. S7-12 TaxID=3126698 RepID=UPI003367B249
MRTTTRGLILLLLSGFLALTAGVLPANAHSRLLSITPADGASLPASPAEIVLTFNETINPQFVTVRVTDGEGGDVVGENATAQGAKVTLAVGEPIAAGTYSVVYRVVSADSHPISGSTSFTIKGNPEAPPASTGTASGSATPSPSETASPSTSASTPSPSTNAAADVDEAAPGDSGDTPVWVWLLVMLGLVGAIGGTFYAVRRDESHS